MKATIKIINSTKIENVLDRADAAMKEIRQCLWELQELGVEVDLEDKNAAMRN